MNYLKKILFIFIAVSYNHSLQARTVRRYQIKQPGKAEPIRDFKNPFLRQEQAYVHEIDESTLQQIQFKRLKEIELEGKQSFEINRKSDITRTY